MIEATSTKSKTSSPFEKELVLPKQVRCPLKRCLLCCRDAPPCLIRSPTWPSIMRVVFFTLKTDRPEKEYFNLKEDVYSVILYHWAQLAIGRKSSSNWKKHIQDMLSHSKELFESGIEVYGQNGYWKLRVNTDPWTITGHIRRGQKTDVLLKRSRDEETVEHPAKRQMIINPAYIQEVPSSPLFGRSPELSLSSNFYPMHHLPPSPVPTFVPSSPSSVTSSPFLASSQSCPPSPSPTLNSVAAAASAILQQQNLQQRIQQIEYQHRLSLHHEHIEPQQHGFGKLYQNFVQFETRAQSPSSPPSSPESASILFAKQQRNPCPVSFLLNE